MHSAYLRRAAALALALTLAACGGGPGAANDPSGSVQAAMTAVSSGGFGKMAEFTCAAKRNDLTNAFGGGGNLAAFEAAGVKAEDIFGAMTFSFSNIATKEVSKTDTAAKVHVTADMKTTVDQAKFKTILKTMMTAQGQPADDATIDALLVAMANSLSQTQKVDEDIDVVNEGGKWLICNS